MNLYTTRNEAVEREIRDVPAPGRDDLLADGGTVEDCYDIDAIADETVTTTVTVGGQPRCCQYLTIDPDLFREIVERHARPVDAEGPALTAHARRADGGARLNVSEYTSCLLGAVPPGSRYPGYTDLLEVAVASVGHLRWLDLPDPWDPWPVLDEEAAEAYRRLAGQTDVERLDELALEIGTWLTDGGEPATIAIGAYALAWAAVL